MKKIQRGYSPELGMVDFGQFSDESGENVKVALMRHAKGSGETQMTVKNAAEVLHPKVALLVGICETMKPEMAKLGDVVISAKLATYKVECSRDDDTFEYNCESKEKVSPKMGKLILSAADGWNPPLKDPNSFEVKVHQQALMLSGSGFIKNKKRVNELKDKFPNAVAVEIKGKGLYKAAHDLEMEWFIIKGVSDLAGGSDLEKVANLWNRFASVMATSVVHNTFKYPTVLKGWPHYKEAKDTQGM
ncbi:5 -methylthioadenosine S-adenosylhomocysteine nucleosidase-like isoform X16 [Paramuricea clavata]|uniref:5 -methylthioadenosine S-adenosylhomocysteine nucleosidase-like isoform X16 n=1 Tax=Paramuricea clavata TaxID=317549 RepID=A0A7D9J0P5_PARCT|nr:5 -methylthioadenosine S-adenosylhomocysteine nucleosidase-like isoform X16 [Paramuricea clavata]